MNMANAMRRWWKRAASLGSLALIAVTLSACVESNSQSVITPDLTGTTTIRIGISKLLVQTLMSIGDPTATPAAGAPPPMPPPSDLFADLKKQIAAMGGTTQDYENANFVGVDATLAFTSLDEMQKQINTLLGSSAAPGGQPTSGAPSDSGLVTITAKDTGDSVRIDGKVDPLSTLTDPTAQNAPGAPPLDVTAILAGGGKVELSFTMPGNIRSTDPLAKTDGTTVSWSFNIGDKAATIFVESDKR